MLDPSAVPAPKPFPWRIVLIIGGIIAFMCCGVGGGCVAYFAAAPEGGVRATNQLDKKTLAELQKKFDLGEGETVRCFYDPSIRLDGEEVVVLTSKRLLYSNKGEVSQIMNDDIATVDHHNEALIGDSITVTSESGQTIHFEVAPLNQGSVFVNALEAAKPKK